MDELVSQFVGITDSTPEKAKQYLNISDNNLEQAIELFFNTGGVDLMENTENTPQATNPTSSTSRQPEVVNLDSDAEDDGDVAMTGTRPAATASTMESDEAMARRLQEEMYGGAGGASGAGGGSSALDNEGYRAPIARTRETLVGPDSYDLDDPSDLRAAMQEQMFRRQQGRAGRGRPGVFNQHEDRSIWNDDGSTSPADLQENLARTTGGASRTSSTHTLLAQMYRPPFDLISNLTWDDARSEGKEDSKWILVNIQDPSIFDCQILNRDIWKHEGIRETIKEHFIFMQYNKDDPRGNQYIQYYFPEHESGDSYPHIAIVDPRTGEKVKVWSGPPVPKASEFLMQLHEFLDRYSLAATAKNPVAKRKPEKRKGFESMTEEEQLELAMQASLTNQAGSSSGGLMSPNENDPDALTRSIGDLRDVKSPKSSNGTADVHKPAAEIPQPSESAPTPFSLISSTNTHTEPASTEPGTTRIQFRHPTGRIVRRFALEDPVRRLYEWLKADPIEGKAGIPFELVSMGKNLIDSLDSSIEQAALRNGTVMVEFVGEGDEA